MRGRLATIVAFITIMTAISMAAASPARSDEIPVLNVQPLCKGIVSQSDTPLETGTRSVTLQECLDAEQVDRESIRKEWSTFDADDRRHCIAEATMGGESSYTDLLTCLEMARDVRKMKH
ncbi:MAG TPA: hypothetical protein VE396_07655 [Xanthobacteraceae bacterium]|jgi:hypothetical protein|nr:hypothetical protein [Xanthobacteraceae bacterium]